MNNEHEFNSQISKRTDFASTINNEHNFSSIFTNDHSFVSLVDGFHIPDTWIVRFVSNTGINVVGSIRNTIRVWGEFATTTGMSINDVLVIMGINPKTEFITNTGISFITSIAQKMGSANLSSSSNFETIMRQLSKITAQNSLPTTTNFEAVISAKKYYLLSDWDGYLLSDLDSMLLSEMDSQIV